MHTPIFEQVFGHTHEKLAARRYGSRFTPQECYENLISLLDYGLEWCFISEKRDFQMTIGALSYCESFAKLTNENLQGLSFTTILVNHPFQVDLFGAGQYTTFNQPYIQNIPQRHTYSEFNTDIHELRKIDIKKKMLVIKNYLFYQKKYTRSNNSK